MDVLVAIVDVHQSQWGKRLQAASEAAGGGTTAARDTLTFATFVDQLIVFFNAFLILNKSNQLCVIGMDSSHSEFIWPPQMVSAEQAAARSSIGGVASAAVGGAASEHDSGSIGVDDELIKQLHAFSARATTTTADGVPIDGEEGSKMAGALSLGLCYLNRVHRVSASSPSSGRLRSRVLIFSLCPDQSSSYVSMMNGIFSTQKQAIPVDACVLAETDSLFLQQASHLTKGIYGRVPMENQHALLQYLMFMYLSDPTSRQHLILPTQTQVDFRATCFCHQQVVDMAVVCPVCLAIFCRSTPTCQVCGTRFAFLQPMAPRPGTPAAAAAAARTQAIAAGETAQKSAVTPATR